MAEKLIPDVDFFAQEISTELQADFQTQRLKTVERLINFPPEKISELHLQDWYGVYWRILNLSQYIGEPPAQTENICTQIIQILSRENNPARRQLFALALLLLGKVQEFNAVADKNFWSENLREDLENFSKFQKLTSLATNLKVRANVRRNLQIKNFLLNKYDYLIKKYSTATLANCPKVPPKDYQIYFCWLQGKENLPPVVQCCYNSLKRNAGKFKIVFIDEKNFSDYVTLPEYILEKLKGGGITRTHFSDIIRINLLEQYGGLWLDSTVLVTEPLENYRQFWKLPYYTQKFYQEKSNLDGYAAFISYGRWAGFIQGAAILHNPIFTFIKEFLNEYWLEFDELINYLLLDYLMDLAYDNIDDVKKEMDAVPLNNQNVYAVLNNLNNSYEKFPYDKILKGNFLNKLSWKVPLDETPNTVFGAIKKKYFGE